VTPCQDYLLDLEGTPRALMEQLAGRILQFPEVVCKIRYRIPFFYRHSWVCYLNPVKGGGVELAFLYGHQLTDPFGLLEARGRKMVKGIRLYELAQLPGEPLEELIAEALILDDTLRQERSGKK